MSDIDPEKLREAIDCLRSEGMVDTARLWLVCAAAESTLPETKEVEVWRVQYAEASPDGWLPGSETYTTLADAEYHARNLNSSRPAFDCIRVTGPHKQRVPA